MKSEVAKAALVSVVLCLFILWLGARRDLPASLVVVFIVAFAVTLPLAVLLNRVGRRR